MVYNILLESVSGKDLEMFKLLVEAGADVGVRDCNGYGVMHRACDWHDVSADDMRDLIHYCTSQGLSINAVTGENVTLLLKAIYEMSTDYHHQATIIRVLIQQNSDLTAAVDLSESHLVDLYREVPISVNWTHQVLKVL